MSVLQRVSFLPNERLDTPDIRNIESFALNDWRFFLSGFFADQSYILQGFEVTNYSTVFTVAGFSVKLSDVVLFHSEATTQAAGFYVFAGTEQNTSISLAANATNFVEVDLIATSGTPDIRAFWDQAANAGAGGEFTDTVNTVVNLRLVVSSNITGFTAGKIPLYRVITNSSNIATSLTDCRNLFFRLGSGGTNPDPDHNFDWPSLPDAAHARLETGITATMAGDDEPFEGGDKNLKTFKDWMDAMMTSIKELRGTSYWYSPTWSSVKLLREYQNIFYSGGGNISWVEDTANTLRFTSKLFINIAGRSTTYELGINGTNNYVLLDGQCLYVSIPEGNTPTLTAVIDSLGNVPVDPSGPSSDPKIMVLFFRKGTTLYGAMDIPELMPGEVDQIGQEISQNVRDRLGIIDDTSYQAYTSTFVIGTNDDYPTALSTLDGTVNAILTDTAQEEEFAIGAGGTTTVTATVLTWDADNTVPDICVYVNGVKQRQSPTGALDKDFRKNSDTILEFAYTVPQNARVVIRDERTGGTGGGGGGGGGTDLQNIVVNPQPITNGAKSLGTTAKAWSALYLKDTANSQVYKIEITAGILQVVTVP